MRRWRIHETRTRFASPGYSNGVSPKYLTSIPQRCIETTGNLLAFEPCQRNNASIPENDQPVVVAQTSDVLSNVVEIGVQTLNYC